MPKSSLSSSIGSLLTAWFGAAVAATLTLLIGLTIADGGIHDPGSLIPVSLLTFMIASVGALPAVLVLVLILLLIRRLLPGLSARPLAMTLILALAGAGISICIVLLYISMFVDTAELELVNGVLSIPLLTGAIGGVVLGAMMARPRLREL